MNEIFFNSSLMREMRAITFVTRLIDEGALDQIKYARINMHAIHDDVALEHLGVATKLNPDWDFLCQLRDAGRRKADEWLNRNFDSIGNRSSVNLAEVYL